MLTHFCSLDIDFREALLMSSESKGIPIPRSDSNKTSDVSSWEEDYELISLGSSQDALQRSGIRSAHGDSGYASSPLRMEHLSSSTIIINNQLKKIDVNESIPENSTLHNKYELGAVESSTSSLSLLQSKEEDDSSNWETEDSESAVEEAELPTIFEGKTVISPSSSGTDHSEAVEYTVPTAPPIPDLRFQQSYLQSIQRANGSAFLVALITLRDHVLYPFLSGGMWVFVRHIFQFLKLQEKGFHFGQSLRRNLGLFSTFKD